MLDFLGYSGLEMPKIGPSIVGHIFSFPIANTTLLSFLIVILFALFALFVSKFQLKPINKGQIIVEDLYIFLSSFIKDLMNNHNDYKKIMPIILSMMLYLIISNIITVIPGLTSIKYNGVEIFRTPTADFNTVLGMSLASVLYIHFLAIQKEGILSYLGNFFKFKELYLGFKKGIGSGMTALIEFFVGMLDIIGEFAKIVSLAFRLFGNIYAGEILLIIILGALAYVLPALWNIYSSFIGILQGIVFASLVAVYYSLTVKNK